MLVTLVKTNVNRRKFPKITETQSFFGRLMAFVMLGQMQAAIVVAGDIFLMKCTPVHPWLMWLAAAVTSLVFVSLIYALTLSFGDLGRALVILLIFVQIAGSSGSYPIEILPEIFGSIYKFFPFPYAINAMREALCGVYGNHFIIYISELLIFFAVAVVIGIFIRRPFIGVKEFMAKKQKETGVM
jgi:putative membrane protein